jgi:hypothetical protein
MGHRYVVVLLAVVLSACSSRGYLTRYPATQASMDRFESGAQNLNCSFTKYDVPAWSTGMREALVTCAGGRVRIIADGRNYDAAAPQRNLEETSIGVACQGETVQRQEACREFAESLWASGDYLSSSPGRENQ